MSNSFVTPWTIAHQAPGPRQEYWSRLLFPSPGDLLDPGIKPMSPAWQVDSLRLSHLGSPHKSLGKCTLKPKWNTTKYALKWLKEEKLTMSSVNENVEGLYCWWEWKIVPTLWKSLEVSHRDNHPIPRYLPKIRENFCSHKNLYANAYNSSIY